MEERVKVMLYKVTESGHNIRHDSPSIGLYQEYGHWEKEHGIYSSKKEANLKREAIILQFVSKKSFSRFKDNPTEHVGTVVSDAFISVKRLEIDKREIATDGFGKMHYQGKEIFDKCELANPNST